MEEKKWYACPEELKCLDDGAMLRTESTIEEQVCKFCELKCPPVVLVQESKIREIIDTLTKLTDSAKRIDPWHALSEIDQYVFSLEQEIGIGDKSVIRRRVEI